jgi:uncharacterized protein (DUF427 family)
MKGRIVKQPGPAHPITIESVEGRVIVMVAGRRLADSTRALVLHEAGYGPVYYVPRDDVDLTMLYPSTHVTYCPYKGDCSYWDIAASGPKGTDAAWSYAAPYPAVAAIVNRFAFYPDRVDAIDVWTT